MRWEFLVLIAGLAACSPGDCPAPPAVLVGKWTYSSSQTQPSATIGGTLTLAAGCPGFQGTLDGTLNDGVGVPTPVHAIVSGQMIGTTGVDFDVSGRRHLGMIQNDSISGTWVDQSSGGSGPFRAAKELTP